MWVPKRQRGRRLESSSLCLRKEVPVNPLETPGNLSAIEPSPLGGKHLAKEDSGLCLEVLL